MENDKKIWIVGCGDIGKRVAYLYNDKTVDGIISSQESALQFQSHSVKSNIVPSVIDLDFDYTLPSSQFKDADLYYFVPPPSAGVKDTRLKRFLNKLSKQLPRRIVMISTTGVYGDSDGEWIDENTAINPQADRAVRRVSAEQVLQRWTEKTHVEFMILRVPGIYAEDRLPLARLKKGLPIVKTDEAGFTNRIHADDLAQACKAAMQCKTSNHIINVTDGSPSTMTDYFNHVADFAKLPRPPQITMREAEKTLSEGMVSYLKESRRIKNDKLLEILEIELIYPSLQHALTV